MKLALPLEVKTKYKMLVRLKTRKGRPRQNLERKKKKNDGWSKHQSNLPWKYELSQKVQTRGTLSRCDHSSLSP